MGTTQLVCSAPLPDRLEICALDVVEAGKVDDSAVEDRIRGYDGVNVHVVDLNGQRVVLDYSLDFRGEPVTVSAVREAVIHVNGAAEALLWLAAERERAGNSRSARKYLKFHKFLKELFVKFTIRSINYEND